MSFISITGTDSVKRLNKTLAEYAAYTKKAPNAILAQAASDLRRFLDYGFRGVKWKGDARKEHEERVSRKSGTMIRKSTLSKLASASAKKVRKRGKGYFTSDESIINAELTRRTRGKGILAISWRLSAWRYAKAGPKLNPKRATSVRMGVTYNSSREFGKLAKVTQGNGFVRMEGLAPGMDIMNRGISDTAVSKTRAKMVSRLNRAIARSNKAFFPSRIK
jgi:hypothetical protein